MDRHAKVELEKFPCRSRTDTSYRDLWQVKYKSSCSGFCVFRVPSETEVNRSSCMAWDSAIRRRAPDVKLRVRYNSVYMRGNERNADIRRKWLVNAAGQINSFGRSLGSPPLSSYTIPATRKASSAHQRSEIRVNKGDRIRDTTDRPLAF